MDIRSKYPLITNILESYLRPDTGYYNLVITLHYVMKESPAAMCSGLVKEFGLLVKDTGISDEAILAEFNKKIPENWQIMTNDNVRRLLSTLQEYIAYLYEVENFKGAEKWNKG